DEDVGGGRPVDLAKGDQELLVNRLEQVEVEVAGADQVGELVAVFEEERLDAAFEGVVAAEEDEELRLRPALDVVGLAENGVVEDEQQAEPDHLDGDLDEEVGAEGQLVEQPEAGEGPQQSQIATDTPHERLLNGHLRL